MDNQSIDINLNIDVSEISKPKQANKPIQEGSKPGKWQGIGSEAREILEAIEAAKVEADSQYTTNFLDVSKLEHGDRRLLLYNTMQQSRVCGMRNLYAYAEISPLGFRLYTENSSLLEQMIYEAEFPFDSDKSMFQYTRNTGFADYWTDERKSAVEEERRLPYIIGMQ